MKNVVVMIIYIGFKFGQVVYYMFIIENDVLFSSIFLVFQSLFYKMQYSDICVVIKDLMKFFGWDIYEFFM